MRLNTCTRFIDVHTFDLLCKLDPLWVWQRSPLLLNVLQLQHFTEKVQHWLLLVECSCRDCTVREIGERWRREWGGDERRRECEEKEEEEGMWMRWGGREQSGNGSGKKMMKKARERGREWEVWEGGGQTTGEENKISKLLPERLLIVSIKNSACSLVVMNCKGNLS